MTPNPRATIENPKPKIQNSPRPRWRLHGSTLVVAAAVAVPLALTILPGTESVSSAGLRLLAIGEPVTCEHGWPWAFVTSKVKLPPPTVSQWMNTKSGRPDPRWHYAFDVRRVAPLPLAADLAIALAAVLVCAALWEWRRRRVARVWQVRLSDIFALTLTAGLGLGWWMSWHNQSVRQQQAVDILCPGDAWRTARNLYLAPRWLSHWVGHERLRATFNVYYSLAMNRHPTQPDEARQLQTLESLTTVTHVELLGAGFSDRWAAVLARLPRLEKVDLIQTAITDQGLAELAQSQPKAFESRAAGPNHTRRHRRLPPFPARCIAARVLSVCACFRVGKPPHAIAGRTASPATGSRELR